MLLFDIYFYQLFQRLKVINLPIYHSLNCPALFLPSSYVTPYLWCHGAHTLCKHTPSRSYSDSGSVHSSPSPNPAPHRANFRADHGRSASASPMLSISKTKESTTSLGSQLQCLATHCSYLFSFMLKAAPFSHLWTPSLDLPPCLSKSPAGSAQWPFPDSSSFSTAESLLCLPW